MKLQTHDIAKIFGLLHDRGTIEVGKRADLNLVDYERLRLVQPRYVHDLPKGAPRWVDETEGYMLTMVNGTITYENGRHTGELPGRLVRNSMTVTAREKNGNTDVPHYRDVAGTKDLSMFSVERDRTSSLEAVTSLVSVGASAVGTVVREGAKSETSNSKL